MDCRKKTKEACKASRKCTYTTGKKKSYCKKKNTTKSLCVKKSETKCKRVRGCKFASGTKRQFCRKNVTKRRKKTMKGGVETTNPEVTLDERIAENTRKIGISLDYIRAVSNMVEDVKVRVDNLEGRMDELA